MKGGEKKMKCSKCQNYSFPLRRCKLGKINPPTLKGAREAEAIMGRGYICYLSKWRDKLK